MTCLSLDNFFKHFKSNTKELYTLKQLDPGFKIIFENVKTILIALVIAIIIRSLVFQPFYIPSSSMEPTLLIGDRIFVSKYTYGFSKHSFPFSPNISNERFFSKSPERGDLVVFKTPADNRTDYIKRLIGMPGDTIQFVDGKLLLNDNEILRKLLKLRKKITTSEDLNSHLPRLRQFSKHVHFSKLCQHVLEGS